MAIFHDARMLAKSQRQRFAKVERSIRILHAEHVEYMRMEAVDLSQGRISSAELRRRGHPYGRGKGRATVGKGMNRSRVARGMAPLLPINRQKGRLAGSWRTFRRQTGDLQSITLQNIAPHSKFVLAPKGTRKMVARGLWARLRKIHQQQDRKLRNRMRLVALQIMLGR